MRRPPTLPDPPERPDEPSVAAQTARTQSRDALTWTESPEGAEPVRDPRADSLRPGIDATLRDFVPPIPISGSAPADGNGEGESEGVGLRDVWRAARARRRALRAEVRRFTSRQRNRRRLWLGSVISILALIIVTVGVSYSPLFAVETVTVVGAEQLSADEVEAALAGQTGVPLARVDSSEVKAALVGFPLVETYTLEARPPHELVVRIIERTPIGIIRSAAGYSVVDAAGVVLSTSEVPIDGLPIIEASGGASSDSFIAVGQVLRSLPDDLRAQVTAVSATSPNDVTLTLGATDTSVVWGGANQSAEKALTLEKTMAARPPETVSSYDVSSPTVAVVG